MSSLSWVTWAALDFPGNAVWQHVWNVVSQGSSPKIWCPGFLLGGQPQRHGGTVWVTSATQTPVPLEVKLMQYSTQSQAYKKRHSACHIVSIICLWPKALGIQRRSIRQYIPEFRGHLPCAGWRPILKTFGMCRVWATQAWWLEHCHAFTLNL